MDSQPEILEQWIKRVAGSHPERANALPTSNPDPFRNPVGFALRNSLSQLWQQLLGEMDPVAVDRALDTILRIRAVQDISPSEAVGFVDELLPLISRLPAQLDGMLLESRIKQLALAASNKYTQCREQIIAVRIHETERLRRSPLARKAHS